MNLPDVFRNNRGLFSEFFRDLDDLFSMRPLGFGEAGFRPAINMQEDDKNFLISVDVPGVRKEDLEIDITDNVLTLSGERRQTFGGEGDAQRGRSYGRFVRSMTLPAGVTADQVEANYENGVLEILIPKGEAQRKRSIEIGLNRGALTNRLRGAEGRSGSERSEDRRDERQTTKAGKEEKSRSEARSPH